MPLNLSRSKSCFKSLGAKKGAVIGILNIFIKAAAGLLILNLSLNINKNIFIISVAIQ